MVKKPPASAGDIRDVGSILGPGTSFGGGHGNPLQYSCQYSCLSPWTAESGRLESMGYLIVGHD